MTEYKIVQNDHLGEFEHLVNEALQQGWHLHGAVVVTANPDFDPNDSLFHYHYAQTMTREKSE